MKNYIAKLRSFGAEIYWARILKINSRSDMVNLVTPFAGFKNSKDLFFFEQKGEKEIIGSVITDLDQKINGFSN